MNNMIRYNGVNTNFVTETINKHFELDSRVCIKHYTDNLELLLPCFADGHLHVKHVVKLGDTIRLFSSSNGFPRIEVIHA